jgi:hypothetical protein
MKEVSIVELGMNNPSKKHFPEKLLHFGTNGGCREKHGQTRL